MAIKRNQHDRLADEVQLNTGHDEMNKAVDVASRNQGFSARCCVSSRAYVIAIRRDQHDRRVDEVQLKTGHDEMNKAGGCGLKEPGVLSQALRQQQGMLEVVPKLTDESNHPEDAGPATRDRAPATRCQPR